MKNKTEKWKTQQRTLAKDNKQKLDKFRQKRDIDAKKARKHDDMLKAAQKERDEA